MGKITKAVIPAAGFGTRMLPFTKAIPKEMIPIVDKPSIQYIVEEAVASGITDILIILSRGKEAVSDHFDRAPELEDSLLLKGKSELYEEIVDIANLANIVFLRQKEVKGLGHAVYQAKSFVGNEPFAVLYGDDVILGEKPVTRQLIKAYDKYGLASCGVKEVSAEAIQKYSSLKVEPLGGRDYKVLDMIEKPKADQIFSLFSILGRVLLTPDIFDILRDLPAGAGGEIQLTDAMKLLTLSKGMTAVDFEGVRYDMGNKCGVLMAAVNEGLKHPQTRDEFKAFLKGLKLD